MNIKHIAAGTLLAVGGYCVGKIVGTVKTIIFTFNTVEEVCPGTKKAAAKAVADKIVDSIYDN